MVWNKAIKKCDKCGSESGEYPIRTVGLISQFPMYDYGSCHLCGKCWVKLCELVEGFVFGGEGNGG